jgi:hypothetical protein
VDLFAFNLSLSCGDRFFFAILGGTIICGDVETLKATSESQARYRLLADNAADVNRVFYFFPCDLCDRCGKNSECDIVKLLSQLQIVCVAKYIYQRITQMKEKISQDSTL